MPRVEIVFYIACILLNCKLLTAQNASFVLPLDTQISLSGTFGEFRGSHFHAGIDIKTFNQTGLPVRAASEGYVSRIKISPVGYGKAIYITHPDGYTTVYGHLSGFKPEIDTYIRKYQYKQKGFSIELFPPPTLFRIRKGEIIAYSGNSGSSSAPHLHFEVRHSKTEDLINPLLLNLGIKDEAPPLLQHVFVVSRNRDYFLREGLYPEPARIDYRHRDSFSIELPEGKYSFIVAGRDYLNQDTSNLLGVYETVLVEGTDTLYKRVFSGFSFKDARFIQLLTSYRDGYPPLEHLYKESWNHPGLARYQENGWLELKSGQNRTIQFILGDEAGHQQRKTLFIKVTASAHEQHKLISYQENGEQGFVHERVRSFQPGQAAIVDFPADCFFDSVFVKTRYHNDSLFLQPDHIRSVEKFRIQMPVPARWTDKSAKICLARIYDGGLEYAGGEITTQGIYALVKSFGTYILTLDEKAPKAEVRTFDPSAIYIHAEDDFSGIRDYECKINGQWFLLEYDPKNNSLTGDLSTFKSGEKLLLELTVTDYRDNSTLLQEEIEIP